MEYEKIKQLMEDMGNSKLKEINIDFPDGTKISMTKEVSQGEVIVTRETAPVTPVESNNQEEVKETKGKIVKSPMVGTFYLKPSPNDKPYIEAGQDIKKGDILCIIEAMKLMNEIESEYSGKVVEILVEDGAAVEYGTDLFVID